MIEPYSGTCVGGPYAGKQMAHWAGTMKLYRPMVGLGLNMVNVCVEAIEIGEYRLNDFGQWHWWETDAGRAYDVLSGAA